tara:strand:- start:117 stop:449 length:333 start_codon:yes stop_codon:yes gene_type:complete
MPPGVSPTNDPTAVKTVKDIESKKVAFSINVYEIRKIEIDVTTTVELCNKKILNKFFLFSNNFEKPYEILYKFSLFINIRSFRQYLTNKTNSKNTNDKDIRRKILPKLFE